MFYRHNFNFGQGREGGAHFFELEHEQLVCFSITVGRTVKVVFHPHRWHFTLANQIGLVPVRLIPVRLILISSTPISSNLVSSMFMSIR